MGQQKCVEATILLERGEPAPHQRADGGELNPVHKGTGRREREKREATKGQVCSLLPGGSTLYRGRGGQPCPSSKKEGGGGGQGGAPPNPNRLGLGLGGGGARGAAGPPFLSSPWRLPLLGFPLMGLPLWGLAHLGI